MNELKNKIEKLNIDNLVPTYVLFKKYAAEYNELSTHYKFSDDFVTGFIHTMSININNPACLNFVVKRGKKAIGFVFCDLVKRDIEPSFLLSIKYTFIEKDYRGGDILPTVFEILKKLCKAYGINHIETRGEHALASHVIERTGFKEVAKTYSIEV